jgi:hypothetical protein
MSREARRNLTDDGQDAFQPSKSRNVGDKIQWSEKNLSPSDDISVPKYEYIDEDDTRLELASSPLFHGSPSKKKEPDAHDVSSSKNKSDITKNDDLLRLAPGVHGPHDNGMEEASTCRTVFADHPVPATPCILKHGTADNITPGAVRLVGGVGTPTALHGDNDVEEGTSLVVAELAPTPEDVEALLEERLERHANELLEQLQERAQIERENQVVVHAVELEEPEDEKESPPPPSKKRWCCWAIVAVAFLLFVIGVTLGVVLPQKKSGEDNPTLSPTPSPTDATTEPSSMATSTMFPTSERLKTLVRVLTDSGLLRETSTWTEFHWSSATWMADTDPTPLDFESTPISTIIERFVIVLLYFATNGDSWLADFKFLTPGSVCGWNDSNLRRGVFCSNLAVSKISLGKSSMYSNQHRPVLY